MKSGNPDADALLEPELPLAPALLAWEPEDWELEDREPGDCELDELPDGIEDDDDEEEDEEEDEGMDDDGMDDELLLDEDEGICGILDDCCDCCVDSHALSNSAVTLRLNRIRVRGMFMITDSNRNM